MDFLKRSTSWTSAEFGLLKTCLICAGIAIGAYFHRYLESLVLLFIGTFLLTAAWSFYLWVNKLKGAHHEKNIK